VELGIRAKHQGHKTVRLDGSALDGSAAPSTLAVADGSFSSCRLAALRAMEQPRGNLMDCAATILPDIERVRLGALVRADMDAAGSLHADDYQLITPNGSEMTKDDYLRAIAAGQLRYQVFEPVSDMAVLGDAPVAVLRYRARISFDDGPGFTCWHTDCYELRNGRWQAVWSQATAITGPGVPQQVSGEAGQPHNRSRAG
jgi:hypothetical protein